MRKKNPMETTPKATVAERRRYFRIETRDDVIVVHGDRWFVAESRDISLGGIFLVSEQPISIGDDIEFEMRLPKGVPSLGGKGKVVHIIEQPLPGRHPGFGVEFVSLDLDIFRQYLRKRMSGEIKLPSDGRRKYVRMKRTLEARLTARRYSEIVKIQDISHGGVFIQTNQQLAKGTKVRIALVHPSTRSETNLTGRVARVVNSNPQDPATIEGVGVVFDDLNKAQREGLETFLYDFGPLGED